MERFKCLNIRWKSNNFIIIVIVILSCFIFSRSILMLINVHTPLMKSFSMLNVHIAIENVFCICSLDPFLHTRTHTRAPSCFRLSFFAYFLYRYQQ